MEEIEDDLLYIIMDSIGTLQLDASFDESDTIAHSVSSGFLHLFNAISDSSKSKLVPSIKSYKLWCQSRALFLPLMYRLNVNIDKC